MLCVGMHEEVVTVYGVSTCMRKGLDELSVKELFDGSGRESGNVDGGHEAMEGIKMKSVLS